MSRTRELTGAGGETFTHTRRFLDVHVQAFDGHGQSAIDVTPLEPPLDVETLDTAAHLLPGPHRRLSPALVALLQSAPGDPSVTLLLTTTRAERMLPADAARLERLRLAAVARLGADRRAGSRVDVLDRLVQHAVGAPTDRAIAIFANQAVAAIVPLPLEVEDRCVVDPTLATRDLVRALHRTPRHVVLTLSAHRAALFDGAGGRLTPAAGAHFPMDLRERAGGDPTSALRQVDRALGTYLYLHPAPLIVAGPKRLVASFRQLSRYTARLAGTLFGSFEHVGLAELAERTRPALERYLLSREQEALAHVERRASARRVASGIASAWLAARTERAEMLAVEEGYWYPARLSADGDLVQPADDVEAPDVIDDLVDELIETVMDSGGWIALVRDGSLAAHERVALTLRPGRAG
ncbi:MAG: hypothetical protein WAL50_12645 [Kineosporiaceae bacterium]